MSLVSRPARLCPRAYAPTRLCRAQAHADRLPALSPLGLAAAAVVLAQPCTLLVPGAPLPGLRSTAAAARRAPVNALSLESTGAAHALETVGSFAASGFVFKDTVTITAFDDPEIKNVTIYLSEMERNIADKFKSDFFNEPSQARRRRPSILDTLRGLRLIATHAQASLACVATDVPEIIDESRLGGREGHELLAQGRNLSLFQQKTLRVRRVWDPAHRTVIYVAYSTRLNSAADSAGPSTGRYKCVLLLRALLAALPLLTRLLVRRTSVCALPVGVAPAPALASP